MPKSSVRTGETGPILTLRYSEEAKRKIIQKLREATRPNEPDFGPQNCRLDNIDWLANEYLMFKRASLFSLPDLRSKVGQLADAAEQLLRVVEEFPPPLWHSIVWRTPNLRPPTGHSDAQALNRYAWDGYFSELLDAGAHEPVATTADHPRNLLGITPGIAKGARAYRDVLQPKGGKRGKRGKGDKRGKGGKRGPRGNVHLRCFILTLGRVYENITGKKPRADYSDTYTEFGGRHGPFVRFVAACLEPIDPDAVNDQLGHTIDRALRSDREA